MTRDLRLRHRRTPRIFELEDLAIPDATPHYFAVSNFYQNWTSPGLITANNDWSLVPSVTGYLGDDTIGERVDPQTILTPSSTVNVLANQGSNVALAAGGVAEFEGLGTAAIQPDSSADAPNLVLSINTTGRSNIWLIYTLRDLDSTADNAIQPVALQYRLGNTGDFINVPAGFVADATAGPNLATTIIQKQVALPSAVNNQSLVQFRIITANAVGNDEWVGVDDITVSSTELAVNTYVIGAQQNSSVSMDADGDAFVVWDSDGQDGSSYGVYGQRYDSAGNKVGSEFQINTLTTNQQKYPSIALDSDGDALVVWASYAIDGDSLGISGQRYDATGMKVGGEFAISSFWTGPQRHPSVASMPRVTPSSHGKVSRKMAAVSASLAVVSISPVSLSARNFRSIHTPRAIKFGHRWLGTTMATQQSSGRVLAKMAAATEFLVNDSAPRDQKSAESLSSIPSR